MADKIEFSLTGIDELLGKLESITHDLKFKGGRYALRKAANIVVADAKSRVSRIDDPDTGRMIADNIAMRWGSKHFKATGDLMFRVGVLTGSIKNAKKGNPDEGKGGATPHAMLVELGTAKAKAQPYLRPAATENINEVINTFIDQYSKAIDRAIKRAQKKKAK